MFSLLIRVRITLKKDLMKTIKISTAALLIFMTIPFGSCKKDEVKPNEVKLSDLILNGNAETGSTIPNNWWNSTGQGKYNVTWTDEESFSPTKSLKISAQATESSTFAFWAQTFNGNMPAGKSITLKVKIRGNLKGTGVSIAIRGDDATSVNGFAKQFATTQGTSPISGQFEWTDYSIKLNTIEASIQSLTIYLIYLQGTTGDVYFDNVSLTY